MPFSTQDETFMAQALELARRGTALTSPGARVGAVLVDRTGSVAGAGFYTYEGIRHAEALALDQAGERTRGGTLYVSLEPCSHHGRTPPCADLVAQSGIGRVVAAIGDPNPLVAGKGFARIREAGIRVETGVLEREARRLNESFARYILNHRPLVTLKSAMTLDGKIAAAREKGRDGASSSTFITGAEARAHVQELRHEADAIMVGVGTVLADDPLLTDRTGRPRRRPLLRLILDSYLRLPLGSQLVQTAAKDLVVFCVDADDERRRALESRGVNIEKIEPDEEGRPDLSRVVERLGTMQIANLLIEGGAEVNGAALNSGIVDKVFFYYAPTVVGSTGAARLIAEPGIAGPLRFSNVSVHQFGDDVAMEAYLRDPYISLQPREANAQKVESR